MNTSTTCCCEIAVVGNLGNSFNGNDRNGGEIERCSTEPECHALGGNGGNHNVGNLDESFNGNDRNGGEVPSLDGISSVNRGNGGNANSQNIGASQRVSNGNGGNGGTSDCEGESMLAAIVIIADAGMGGSNNSHNSGNSNNGNGGERCGP
jgi:hypothetical protein